MFVKDKNEYELLTPYLHKGTNSKELSNVASHGGHIVYGRLSGQLAVTRAIGDYDFNEKVIKIPHINNKDMLDENVEIEPIIIKKGFQIAMFCDGITDVLEYGRISDVLNNYNGTNEGKAKELVSKAINAGSNDNCTTIMIIFD